MLFRQFFDPKLAQYAYLVGCQRTGESLLVDPERDIDQYVEAARDEGLEIVAVAETHIHADFLSGAREFAHRHGTRIYLSDEGGEDWASDWARDGGHDGGYDVVFLKHGESFHVGGIEIRALHTPGHTPEHLSFEVIDRGSGASTPMGVLTGDFVFVGDLGRPDLLEQAAGLHGVQEPSARQLYGSLPRFIELEDHLQVWPAHGAGSTCGKALGAVPQSTVGYEKRYNASLAAAQGGEDHFVGTILDGQPEPQTYFARMKRDNNRGVPLLDDLPRPTSLKARQVAGALDPSAHDGRESVVVDTRADRSAFMARHLPGSLAAPLNRSFNAVVGSLVADETTPLILVVEEARLEEAVRDLIRIGFDHIPSWIAPEELEAHFEAGGVHATIPEADFDEVARARDEPGVAVVDVRFRSEYDEGHVPGAVSASYTRLPSYLDERIPSGKTLYVHCASGGRASAGASFLAMKGHDVRVVNDTFARYRSEGGAVEIADAAAEATSA